MGLPSEHIIELHNKVVASDPNATLIVASHFGSNPPLWSQATWEWLLNHPVRRGVYLWQVTQDVYDRRLINTVQMQKAMDVIWDLQFVPGTSRPALLENIIRHTTANNIGIIRHIASTHQKQYIELFARLGNDHSLRGGLECMLHNIDHTTDTLIATTSISTPTLNDWRTKLQLAQRLKAELETYVPTRLKKI